MKLNIKPNVEFMDRYHFLKAARDKSLTQILTLHLSPGESEEKQRPSLGESILYLVQSNTHPWIITLVMYYLEQLEMNDEQIKVGFDIFQINDIKTQHLSKEILDDPEYPFNTNDTIRKKTLEPDVKREIDLNQLIYDPYVKSADRYRATIFRNEIMATLSHYDDIYRNGQIIAQDYAINLILHAVANPQQYIAEY